MGYNRIHLDGTLGSGNERWSTSIAFQGTAGGSITDDDELTAWAEAVRTAFAAVGTWQTELKGMWGGSSSLVTVRAYHYDTPGSAATSLGVSTGAAVPGSGTLVMPFQSALVFTLRTNRPGRSYRGRSYWPFLTGTISSTGQTGNSTSQQAKADAFKAMLNAISAAAPAGLGARPVIASASTGSITIVSQVRLGNVIDTQRRRTQDVPETFVVSAVP